MSDPTSVNLSASDRDILRVVGKSWGWVLFFGIVTLGLGIVVTLHPKDTFYAFAIVVGIWLFVAGLFRIIVAIADSEDTGGERWLIALLGLVSVVVGILVLHHTDETITTLAFLLGLFWVIGGIIEFFTAYSDRGAPARVWRIAMGVLAFAAGGGDPGLAPPDGERPGRDHRDLVDHLRPPRGRALRASAQTGLDLTFRGARPRRARW